MHIFLSSIVVIDIFIFFLRVYYLDRSLGKGIVESLFGLGRRFFSVKYLFYTEINESLSTAEKSTLRKSNLFLTLFYTSMAVTFLSILIMIIIKAR